MIHTYTYVCVYIEYVCVYMYLHMYIHICIYIYIYMYMHVFDTVLFRHAKALEASTLQTPSSWLQPGRRIPDGTSMETVPGRKVKCRRTYRYIYIYI